MTLPAELSSNPLLRPSPLRRGALPLNEVKTAHFLPAVKYGIAVLREEINAIRDNPEAPTFANTVEKLERAGKLLEQVGAVFTLFGLSKSSGVLRRLEKKIDPLVTDVYNELFQDEKLFARVSAVRDNPSQIVWLDHEQRMLLKDTLKSFTDNGVDLPPEEKKRFRAIDKELADLESKFRENVIEATAAFKLFIRDESRLAGLPDRVKKELKDNAIKAGRPGEWLVLLQPYPDEIMTHADDRTLREELYRADMGVGMQEGKWDNRGVARAIVALRHERARIMGLPTAADHLLANTMAGNVATVMDFLTRGLRSYKPAAESYLAKVRACAGDEIDELHPWDIKYYGRKLKESLYKVEMEAFRPYLELNNTLKALRAHARAAFGVDLRPAPRGKYPVHNSDVRVHEAFNAASGSFIGLFYANYYARAGAKEGGAWMDELQSHYVDEDGCTHTPAITNDCNFRKNADGTPTLLGLEDGETVFHEFGHAMHGLLTEAKYKSQAGTRVRRDFVELPSQLQEEWFHALLRSSESDLGRHHETGRKIPLALLDSLREMNKLEAGFWGLRQTFSGLLDMKWHTQDPATIRSLEALEDEVAAVASLLPRVEGCSTSASFTHLFSGGYEAGYYGYKWADVAAADVAHRALGGGRLYDADVLDAVNRYIYRSGGTMEHEDAYEKVMGRRVPDPNALFRREGITPVG